MGGFFSCNRRHNQFQEELLLLAREREREELKEERRLHHLTIRNAMLSRLLEDPRKINYPPLSKEVAHLGYFRDFHHPYPVDDDETSSDDSVPEKNFYLKRSAMPIKDHAAELALLDVKKSAAPKIPLEAILKNTNNNNPNVEPYYGVHPFLTKSKPMPVTKTKPSLVVPPPNSERPSRKRVDEGALVKNVLPKSILKKDRGAMSKDRYPLRRPRRKDITGLTKSKPEHNRHKGVKASKLPLAVSRPVEVNTSLPWNKKSNLKEAEVPERISNTETVRNFKISVPPLEETMQENLVLPPSRSQSTENLKVTVSPSLEALKEFAAAFTLKMKNSKVKEPSMKQLKAGSEPKASLCGTEVPTWDWNTMEPLKIIVQPRVDLDEVQSPKFKEPSHGERENILPLQLSEPVAGDLNCLRSLEVKDFKLPPRSDTVGNFNTSTLILDEENNTTFGTVAKPSLEVLPIQASDVSKKSKTKSRRGSKKKSKTENPNSVKSGDVSKKSKAKSRRGSKKKSKATSRACSPSTPAAGMVIDETNSPLSVFPGLPRLEAKEPPRSETLEKIHTSTLILDEENNKTFGAIVKPREVIDSETIQASDVSKKSKAKSRRGSKKKSKTANPNSVKSCRACSPSTPAAMMVIDETSFPIYVFPGLPRLEVKEPPRSETLEKFHFGKPREVIDSETIQVSDVPKKSKGKSRQSVSNNNLSTSGEKEKDPEVRVSYSELFFNNYEPASCIKLNEEVNYPVQMIPRNVYGHGRRVAFSSPLTEGRYIYTPVIEIESNAKVIEKEIKKAKAKAKRTLRNLAARRQQELCSRLAQPKERKDGVLHPLAFDRYRRSK